MPEKDTRSMSALSRVRDSAMAVSVKVLQGREEWKEGRSGTGAIEAGAGKQLSASRRMTRNETTCCCRVLCQLPRFWNTCSVHEGDLVKGDTRANTADSRHV